MKQTQWMTGRAEREESSYERYNLPNARWSNRGAGPRWLHRQNQLLFPDQAGRAGAPKSNKKGGTIMENEKVATPTLAPKCPYCRKPIETPVQRKIFSRPPRGVMTFCSEECGGYYQMGCEG